MKRSPGRPRKVDPTRKKISVDQAVKLTQEYWSKFDKDGYSKGSIYNMVSAGKLQKEKHEKGILLFEDEILEKLCG